MGTILNTFPPPLKASPYVPSPSFTISSRSLLIKHNQRLYISNWWGENRDWGTTMLLALINVCQNLLQRFITASHLHKLWWWNRTTISEKAGHADPTNKGPGIEFMCSQWPANHSHVMKKTSAKMGLRDACTLKPVSRTSVLAKTQKWPLLSFAVVLEHTLAVEYQTQRGIPFPPCAHQHLCHHHLPPTHRPQSSFVVNTTIYIDKESPH